MRYRAPASEKQIARARPQPGVLVAEDAALYDAVVRPYVDALDPKSVAWIGHVLDLSKEKERVLFNDANEAEGFLLNVEVPGPQNLIHGGNSMADLDPEVADGLLTADIQHASQSWTFDAEEVVTPLPEPLPECTTVDPSSVQL